MATLVILRGLPASGKSTWARKAAATTPNTVVVSLDGLRRMTAGGLVAYHQRRTDRMEQLIVRAAHAMVCDALRKGMNVVMDAQNATVERVHALVRLAADCEADVQMVAFSVPLETLLERNRARAKDDRVPEDYLQSQFDRFADKIAVPMQWVRVPVEPAGRHMWRPNEHSHTTRPTRVEHERVRPAIRPVCVRGQRLQLAAARAYAFHGPVRVRQPA